MQGNREIVLRMFDAFRRGSFDEAVRLCDPEVELDTLFSQATETEMAGHEGLRRWFESIRETFAFSDVRWRAVLEYDNAWVIGKGTTRARGIGSSEEISWEWYAIAKVVNELIVKIGVYLTREQALEAIERDRHPGGEG